MRVRGVDLAVRSAGPDSGPVLLWGHALMGSAAQEDEAGILPWQGLASAGIRVVRWDARGHGASEATLEDEHYRWDQLALDLWALADAEHVKQAMVGGVSMGAATALCAAVQAPERTRALVLMAPPTAWESRPAQARIYRGGVSLIDRLGLTPFRWLGEATSLATPNRGLAAIQRSVMRGLRGADPRTVQAILRGAALSDLPSREHVAALEIPTLILAWTRDSSHPLSTAETLAEILPRAELQIAKDLSEIRHWAQVTREFLASV